MLGERRAGCDRVPVHQGPGDGHPVRPCKHETSERDVRTNYSKGIERYRYRERELIHIVDLQNLFNIK